MHLLLVEDNLRLAELIAERFRDIGWTADSVATFAAALASYETRKHDLAIVDLGLPDGDGINLVRLVRQRQDRLPMLVLTARTSLEERVDGLDAGADDYLTKPFMHEELIARCRSILRRIRKDKPVGLSAGNLHFDPERTAFSVDGRSLHVTSHAQIILEVLLEDTGRVVTRQRLEDALSHAAQPVSGNAFDQEISRLRRKLMAAGASCAIETIRGSGYLLRSESQ